MSPTRQTDPPAGRQTDRPEPVDEAAELAEALALADELGPSRPAPLGVNTAESLAQLRVRAMQIAEYYRLIEVFIGPADATNVNPSEWRYLFTPAGVTLAELGRKEPPYLHATEVLPTCFQLAVAAGIPDAIKDLRYREGLPW